MIVKASVRLGLQGCEIKDDVEVEDEALEDLDDEARAEVIMEEVREWALQYVEWSYEVKG